MSQNRFLQRKTSHMNLFERPISHGPDNNNMQAELHRGPLKHLPLLGTQTTAQFCFLQGCFCYGRDRGEKSGHTSRGFWRRIREIPAAAARCRTVWLRYGRVQLSSVEPHPEAVCRSRTLLPVDLLLRDLQQIQWMWKIQLQHGRSCHWTI